MFASLMLVAAATFPAGGTYTYQIQTPSAAYTSTVVIAPAFDGIRTHETFGAPAPLAQTDQQFDAGLAQRSFTATQAGKGTLTIAVSPNSAIYSIGGQTTNVALEHPACTLIEDNILTSSVMLPAVVRATGATQCTFLLSTSPHTVVADVATALPATRPPQAAAGDAAVTMHLASITEIVWYDPQTLIPDYMDFGNGASATLTSRAPSSVIPSPAPAATPFVSNFRSHDVSFTSKDGSVLAGTISYPDGAGPFPIVILLQGSGVNDRNETIGPNPVFAELADALNARGYAVLRYDKRWGGASHSAVPETTVVRADAVADGVAAVAFVQSASQIDASRVYFLGHSEGGELVLGIALAGAPLRGVIMLSPLAMNYTAIIERQIERNHVSGPEATQLRAAEKSAYIMSFNAVDPVKEVREVQQPMLLVHGSNDLNVTDDDLRPFIAAAKSTHPTTFTDVELAGDSHLFAQISGPDAAAGVDIATRVMLDPRLIDALAAWLAAH
jgi:uncharacterized protein